MEHPNGATKGVLYRTSKLFNSKRFSDVEFQVGRAEGCKIFHAHKLILCMAGEEFEQLFYRKLQASNCIRIVNFTPRIFEKMLQYVYCDRIYFSSLEEAMDLIKISKKFRIHSLVDICDSYISRFQFNIDTVMANYEIAVYFPHHRRLPMCRRFVCQNTKVVFESPKFCSASESVVEDIVKLNNLSVTSEMDVIEAVIQWGQAQCKQKNRPPSESLCLREETFCFFKYIRFLCLDINQFIDFEEKYDILLSDESTRLTAKILDKDKASLTLPPGFSSINTPRRGLNIASLIGVSSDSKYLLHKSEANVSVSNFSPNSPKIIAPPMQPKYSQRKADSPQPISPNGQLPVISLGKNMACKFPLHEMQKEITSAFATDVKCNATVTVLRGIVLVHGIELQIKNLETSINELIEVHMCLSEKLNSKSNSHTVQLKNNTLELSFNELYRVSSGNPLDVEVTIEDLKLSRCFVCRLEESTLELNCGSGITARITVNSNQTNGTDSIFFLISKLIYSIP